MILSFYDFFFLKAHKLLNVNSGQKVLVYAFMLCWHSDQYLTQQEKNKAGQLDASFPIFFQLLINSHILYSEK